MSYYKINGITVNPPVGTVIQYLGTSDPPGWVICDGIPRTNSGIYTNVASKGFGTLSNGIYTPPDLTGSFLLGANGTIGYKSGDANKILNGSDMPSHSHPMVHSHLVGRRGTDSQYSYAANYNATRIPRGKVGSNQEFYEQNGAYSSGPYAFYPGSGEGGNVANTLKDYTGNAGNSTPFSIMPSYYVVNYILKY